jgi:hypothetical protein
MREGKCGNWMTLLLAVTTAVDGWLMLGPLAQSTLIAVAVVRRLRDTMSTVRGRVTDAK